ncbi:hypothetical protein [Streptomyces europaeiscabiei]|uniref:hypothetical protein n=1 Tax=Streptomyces europaeiscabiei TaxID=146819 RepID=UPI002E0E0849|nr:hypothetical protein OHB30_33410 [Streptomyces europaeiscabiei]
MSTAGQLRTPPLLGEAFGGRLTFHDKPATDTTWYDMPGMTLTLPEAGTYSVTTEVTGQVAAPPNNALAINQRLLVNGALFPNSGLMVIHHGQAGTGGPSVWSAIRCARTARYFITTVGGEVLKVQVQRLASAANGAPLSPGQAYTGVLGAGEGGARIEYQKVGN